MEIGRRRTAVLTWNESIRRDQSGKVVSVSYTAQIPHWGRASIHPHIHHPGELFLNCPALGIDMHPLGQVLAKDAWDPANTALMRALRDQGIWCLEAMAAIGGMDDTEGH